MQTFSEAILWTILPAKAQSRHLEVGNASQKDHVDPGMEYGKTIVTVDATFFRFVLVHIVNRISRDQN